MRDANLITFTVLLVDMSNFIILHRMTGEQAHHIDLNSIIGQDLAASASQDANGLL